MTGNMGNSFDRGISPLNGMSKNEYINKHEVHKDNFFSTRNLDILKNEKGL